MSKKDLFHEKNLTPNFLMHNTYDFAPMAINIVFIKDIAFAGNTSCSMESKILLLIMLILIILLMII